MKTIKHTGVIIFLARKNDLPNWHLKKEEMRL